MSCGAIKSPESCLQEVDILVEWPIGARVLSRQNPAPAACTITSGVRLLNEKAELVSMSIAPSSPSCQKLSCKWAFHIGQWFFQLLTKNTDHCVLLNDLAQCVPRGYCTVLKWSPWGSYFNGVAQGLRLSIYFLLKCVVFLLYYDNLSLIEIVGTLWGTIHDFLTPAEIARCIW